MWRRKHEPFLVQLGMIVTLVPSPARNFPALILAKFGDFFFPSSKSKW